MTATAYRDDQLLIDLVFQKLNYVNQVIYFSDSQKALEYLEARPEMPFLILSDINRPKLDGFALRHAIHADAQLRAKCIPYLFISTGVSEQMVLDAYGLSVQGFFIKNPSFTEIVKTI